MNGNFGNGAVNVIDFIDMSNENLSCSPIPEVPVARAYMASTYYQGRLYACGGIASYIAYSDCLVMDDNLIWIPGPSMPDERSGMASSSINGIWWITGGFANTYYEPDDLYIKEDFDTTLIFDGFDFSYGPKMPEKMDNHCQLTLNETHVFIAARFSTSAFMFNWETQEWITLDPVSWYMPQGMCGLLDHPENGKEILIADDMHGRIFSLTSETWREGPTLPGNTIRSSSAPVEDGFLAIGGNFRNGQFLDTIYRFHQDSYEWELLDQKLRQERASAATATVPESFLNCT